MDSLFTTHSVNLPVKLNQPFTLVPFGDVHFDAPMFAADIFDDFCARYRHAKNTYFIGMGDYVEIASASERRALKTAALHESTAQILEDLCDGEVRKFAKKIGWMRDKLIGMLEGNHHFEFHDGSTSSSRIADKLGAQYLGIGSIIRLNLQFEKSKSATLHIFAHHGQGAARLTGSSFNRVEQMAEAFEGDIYIMGHDHGLGSLPDTKLRPFFNKRTNKLEVKERRVLYVRSGSFLKGYEPGRVGYVARACKRPKPLGAPELEITVKRTRRSTDDNIRVELRGIA